VRSDEVVSRILFIFLSQSPEFDAILARIM
jgi:hypothetical protein